MAVERELKVVGEPGVALPDLGGVVHGGVLTAPATVVLDATYYDTDAFSLARHGVSLRSRTGDGGPLWTLKLPQRDDRRALQRQEVRFDGVDGEVPAAAIAALTALHRGAALEPVAQLRTTRTTTRLELAGTALLEIDDDLVDAKAGGRSMAFRELEVEVLDDAGAALLKPVRSLLADEGWAVDDVQLPKIERVLGDDAVARPDVVVPRLGHKPKTAAAVTALLARSIRDVFRHDAGTRLGVDPEDLHQFRVATRRLRSDLRTFRTFLDPTWANGLRVELGWLGEQVGAVRDLDVLGERLAARIAALPEGDRGAGARLLARLDHDRALARSAMLQSLESERYLQLLEDLLRAAASPVFASDSGDLDRLASRTFPGAVRKPWKRLRRAADDLTASSSDDELHTVRILAKRCRYAAEGAADMCGADARRFAEAVKELQSVLGDHQDTVVAEAWVRRVAKSVPSLGLVCGLILAAEAEDRAALRAQVPDVWARLARPSRRAWMS